MADLYRMVTTFPFKSAIPRDVSVNVMHFTDPTSDLSAEQRDDLFAAFRAFYAESADPGEVVPVLEYMSDMIVQDAVLQGIFHLNFVTGEWSPVEERTSAFGDGTNNVSLPMQCAACVTWTGNRDSQSGAASLLSKRSRRGRNYIGPLNTSALSSGTGSGGFRDPFISAGLRESLLAAQPRLVADLQEIDSQLVIFSPTHNAATIIEGGWIDNEMDIQRRRAQDATERYPWGDPLT